MAGQVAVVGGGAAGSAAAWLLAKRGARVVLLEGGSGSSALYSGALDGSVELDADSLAFAAELGIWSLAPGRSLQVATGSCVLRECRGADSWLLDCQPLSGARIAVADVPRVDWDARLLARALEASPWAQASGTRFEARPVDLFQHPAERLFGAYDFGRQFDEPARGEALCAALLGAGSSDAWLLGPWLGLEPASLERLRKRLGVPVGETTSLPGGLAGARFELARTRLLQDAGVELRNAVVQAVAPKSNAIQLDVLPYHGERQHFEAAAVVLALGGVAGGGVRLAHSFAERAPGRPFELSVSGDLPLGLDGHALDDVASLHGVDLIASGLSVLERVGVSTDGARVRGYDRIFAAGDVVAGRPRTMLEAVRAGCEAARQLLAGMPR